MKLVMEPASALEDASMLAPFLTYHLKGALLGVKDMSDSTNERVKQVTMINEQKYVCA